MSSVLSLVRKSLSDLIPYESARSLNFTGSVFLDANESYESSSEKISLHRYPEPQPKQLLARFSDLYDVDPSMLLMGRGSDEAIDLIVRAFCEPGKDRILICPPTYGMYEISAKIQNAGVVRVPLIQHHETFVLDEDAIRQAIKDKSTKIIFLCSPNNPTGTAFYIDSILRICEMAEGKCLVVVDEAYKEFNGDRSVQNAIPTYPHLIVLRTLSKAWGAAGVRCGTAIAQHEIIQVLNNIRAPYPLSSPSIQFILEITDEEHQKALQARVQKTLKAREELANELRSLHQVAAVYRSAANFLLVKFINSKMIFEMLKARGIIVRDRSKDEGLENCLRITIGTEEENRQLISTLRKAYEL